MYPSISKYNAKSCNCCQHLCTNTTITPSVNGRTFSVINNSICVNTQNCNMQYVGQTCCKLKNRLVSTIVKLKKTKKIDTFLYQHLKRTGHSPDYSQSSR